EAGGNRGDRFLRQHQHEADATVEGAPHLLVGHRALALQPLEHRRQDDGRGLDVQAQALGDDADDVLGQAATGDVGHGVDRLAVLAQQRQHRLHVQPGGGHQRVGQGHAADLQVGRAAGAVVDAADQRIAVGVRAGGGDAQQHVAGADLGAVQQLRLLHRADGEAPQVVLARRVHVGHLGGLAADQGAAGLLAAAGDAADHGDRGVHVQLAGGEVVEEEQRLGALDQDVVDAHGDQVDADGVVAAQLLGQLELGAHAVGAGDQDRLAVLAGQVEQGAEPAQPAHHLGAEAAPHQRLDPLDDLVAGVDVHARVAVGQGSGRRGLAHVGACGCGKGRDSTSRARAGDAPGTHRECKGGRPSRGVDWRGGAVRATIRRYSPSPEDFPMPVRRGPTLFLALLLCLPLMPALAQDGLRTEGEVASAQGLYAAEVPVNSQVDSARQAGYARALAQVLAKLSGDAGVASRPGVAQELRNADAYVDGYDYRQDQSTSPGGAPTFRTMLVVRFQPEAVDALVSALGLPVWAQPRPKPVVWLAIDDGSGPRLLGTGQVNAARPLLDRATERGYRLGLPTGAAAEQAVVGAIWRGDTAAVARASARYS